MATSPGFQHWVNDEAVLARIGAVFSSQMIQLKLRIPSDLAQIAVLAWERDDLGELSKNEESVGERTTRRRAGSLALIGLAITEDGNEAEGDVVVDLDPWLVGDAVLAAIDSAEAG